jgi:hypothetical protein
MPPDPSNVSDLLSHLPDYIAAIAGIGSAATGLVDTTKLFGGGVSRAGYKIIEKKLTPFNKILEKIPEHSAWETIYGNWINGMDEDDQKSKTKALIKLGFTAGTAQVMADATGLAFADLQPLAASFDVGTPLTGAQVNIYGRLDAIISSILDAAYEQADQRYRNSAKGLAALIAVVLSVGGACTVYNGLDLAQFFQGLIVGLVATPLAPVAKDLTTAITTAVQSSGQLKALLK